MIVPSVKCQNVLYAEGLVIVEQVKSKSRFWFEANDVTYVALMVVGVQV